MTMLWQPLFWQTVITAEMIGGPMAAMMNGGMNNWMNNPFAYLMFLALLRNGGFGFGDGHGAGVATQGIEMQAQLNALARLKALLVR